MALSEGEEKEGDKERQAKASGYIYNIFFLKRKMLTLLEQNINI